MSLLRPIAVVLGCAVLTTGAVAQISLTPPAAQAPASKPAAKKEEPKHAPKPKAAAEKKQAAPKPATSPTPPASPTHPFDDPNVDLVYGAYQRGLYKTTFDLATNRADYARWQQFRRIRKSERPRP